MPCPWQAGHRGVATSATIDRNLAILTRPSGSLTLPVKAFRGVAVRMEMVGPTGELSVVLELNHADPSLSLPLIVAGDPAEVAADWQAWSRCLGLTMLLIEQDGSITRPIKTLGAIVPGSPKPRRMYSFFAGRRPRFLARRRTGWVRGAEILPVLTKSSPATDLRLGARRPSRRYRQAVPPTESGRMFGSI